MLKVVGNEYSEELQENRYMVLTPYSFYKEHLKQYEQVEGSYNARTKEISVWMSGPEVVFNKYMNSDDAERVMKTEVTIYAARKTA